MKNYDEAIDFLYDQLPVFQRSGVVAYKNNLDNTLELDDYFAHPHRHFKSIHVAGTNGKGSVSHILSSILQEAGYKTGLYTSPHLRDFRERIRVNGCMISKVEVTNFVNCHEVIIREVEPSFFEMTVAMAFDFFSRSEIDVAVVEVGLGGRLDSTNIINPLVSVITNIGFDHTALLGNTLTAIAGEKAGIIKPAVPVVVGRRQKETEPVFIGKAIQNDSSIVFAADHFSVAMGSLNDGFRVIDIYHDNNLFLSGVRLPLAGIYQSENVACVMAAVMELRAAGFVVSKTHIKKGLENVIVNTGLMGRWQVLEHHPQVVCDTGHNEDGIRQVVAQLKECTYEQLHVVIGMAGDKEVDEVMALMPKDAVYYFTRADIPRSMPADKLMQIGHRHGLRGDMFHSVKEAVAAAKKNASVNDLIFIGGSNFVVAEVV
ncbi:bifunctional folylpolyglutamate synthase/dihydrofolate synthase [Geofilum sp. OHC36d9]|uniref:bifunctional folylpolyglutamate synthase/dihydrofolate synthase n=1 Tax=Geofilum sp. OHC36d9 TaxID=3458413 RepID=UPI004034BB24